MSGIIRLAKGIGARTADAGIESADVFDALLNLGCDFGQGFYLAPPAPAEVITRTHFMTVPRSTKEPVVRVLHEPDRMTAGTSG